MVILEKMSRCDDRQENINEDEEEDLHCIHKTSTDVRCRCQKVGTSVTMTFVSAIRLYRVKETYEIFIIIFQ